jgi:hypothetical protein
MRFDHSSGQYLNIEGARIYFETTGAVVRHAGV